MDREVFICYSSADRDVAQAVCEALETAHVRCWIAPRDIPPGSNYGRAIVDAINSCRVVLLILSPRSNHSVHVLREIQLAVDRKARIIPLRTEDVAPSRDLEYFVSSCQWFDAFPPPVARHARRLAQYLNRLLQRPEQLGEEDVPPPPPSLWQNPLAITATLFALVVVTTASIIAGWKYLHPSVKPEALIAAVDSRKDGPVVSVPTPPKEASGPDLGASKSAAETSKKGNDNPPPPSGTVDGDKSSAPAQAVGKPRDGGDGSQRARDTTLATKKVEPAPPSDLPPGRPPESPPEPRRVEPKPKVRPRVNISGIPEKGVVRQTSNKLRVTALATAGDSEPVTSVDIFVNGRPAGEGREKGNGWSESEKKWTQRQWISLETGRNVIVVVARSANGSITTMEEDVSFELLPIEKARPPIAKKAYLGLRPDTKRNYGSGVYLIVPVFGSPAYGAVRDGDRLDRFNRQPIKSWDDYERALLRCHPGDPVEMDIVRQGSPIKLHVVVGTDGND
jgi:hypothetical protein